MQDYMQNLADVNYIIFCSALQFVLLLVFSSIRTFTHSSLPHMLALLQLQSYAVLFVGHVLWVLVAPTGAETTTTEETGETTQTTETAAEAAGAAPADGVQTARVVKGSAADVGVVEGVAVQETVQDNDTPVSHKVYWTDMGQCLREAGVHVAGLFMVLALGVFLLCVAASVACATESEGRLCVITWQSDEGLWVGIAFTIVQASVAVTSITMYARKTADCMATPPALVAHKLLLYSFFVWVTQHILDRYNRIYSAELCRSEYRGSQELRVYSYIYIGISTTIIFLAGCSYNDTLARHTRIENTQFVVSARIVLPLTFVFCLATVGLMYKTHSDTHTLDTILVAYISALAFLCVTFIRAWLWG